MHTLKSTPEPGIKLSVQLKPEQLAMILDVDRFPSMYLTSL